MKEKTNIIQKDNQKARGKMILFTILAGILGAIVGGMITMGQDSIQALFGEISQMIIRYASIVAYGLPTLALIITIAVLLWVIVNLKKIKEMTTEEDKLEIVEKRLSLYLIFTNGVMLLHFFVFPTVVFLEYQRGINKNSFWEVIYSVGVLVIGMIAVLILQQKTVDIMRIINPEKRGSIYDIKFQKKWEESCDEAEKSRMYRSGYKAFRTVNNVCRSLWLVFILLGIATGTGFLALIAVLIIWTVLTFSYSADSMKQ